MLGGSGGAGRSARTLRTRDHLVRTTGACAGNAKGLPIPDSGPWFADGGDPTSELRDLEPVFHRRRHIHDAVSFDAAVPADFWEVGASGQRYERTMIREIVLNRLDEPSDGADRENWVVTDFAVREIGPSTYLATYLLDQHGRRSRRATIWTLGTRPRWQVRYHQGTLLEAPERREAAS